ncbi:MAG: ATP12 family protein [Pseudomonadota bacterium]|nr:ATP12 family protein [Pseudomonadota bacterium]
MKRVYRDAVAGVGEGGYTVELDGRAVKTPASRLLVLGNVDLAQAVAVEWAAQGETIEPDTMPLTRLATTTIDRVSDHRDRVIDEIAAFGATDLLCYRAASPVELAARQADGWQPLLDWLADRHGSRLVVTEELTAAGQPEDVLAVLRELVAEFSTPVLAALHTITASCGSLIIALALADGRIDAEQAWRLSRIDETYQGERWGLDPEIKAQGERLRGEIAAAAHFLELCS